MRISRQSVLECLDSQQGDTELIIRSALKSLFCVAEPRAYSPFERTLAPQEMCRVWINNMDVNIGDGDLNDTIDKIVRFLTGHITDISKLLSLRAALAVYNLEPSPGEYLPSPLQTSLDLLNFLEIPLDQPNAIFMHMRDNGLVHAHILFSRHKAGISTVLKEGKSMCLGVDGRRHIKSITRKGSREALKEIVEHTVAKSGETDALVALSDQGIFRRYTNSGKVFHSLWGLTDKPGGAYICP